MAELVLRVGSRSAQGVRSNNEDRFVVDLPRRLFLVADGMGGQERGEVASTMAADEASSIAACIISIEPRRGMPMWRPSTANASAAMAIRSPAAPM